MNGRSLGTRRHGSCRNSVGEPCRIRPKKASQQAHVRFLQADYAQDADPRSYRDGHRSDTADLVVVRTQPAVVKPSDSQR